MLPESKTVLELIMPEAFFECCKVDLNLKNFSDLEAACLMRVLAKPELDNSVILNEFALILENFGVPLLDGTISDEEDFVAEGMEKPKGYDLKKIDEEGIQIMEMVARHLLKEYHKAMKAYDDGLKLDPDNAEIKQAQQKTVMAIQMGASAGGGDDNQRAENAMKDPEI